MAKNYLIKMYLLILYKLNEFYRRTRFKTLKFNSLEEAKLAGEEFLKESPIITITEQFGWDDNFDSIDKVTGNEKAWSYRIHKKH